MNVMIALVSAFISLFSHFIAIFIGAKFDSSHLKLSEIKEVQLPDAFPEDFARKVANAFPETTKKCSRNMNSGS